MVDKQKARPVLMRQLLTNALRVAQEWQERQEALENVVREVQAARAVVNGALRRLLEALGDDPAAQQLAVETHLVMGDAHDALDAEVWEEWLGRIQVLQCALAKIADGEGDAQAIAQAALDEE